MITDSTAQPDVPEALESEGGTAIASASPSPAGVREPEDLDLDLVVSGMTCGSCAARVERTLARQLGVARAAVNLATS